MGIKQIKRSRYFQGVLWLLLAMTVSVLNDVFAKFLGENLHSVQITFLRFFFGTLVLVPFLFKRGNLYTSNLTLHIFRAILLFSGIALWCYGLKIVPISTATTLNFTIPLFTLPLAYFFLKEKVGPSRWIATLLGFLGVILVLNPTRVDFNPFTLLLLLSSLLFASLDVINKRFIVKESMIAMLFYTALLTTLIAAVPAIKVWILPTVEQWLACLLLGGGANLILFFLLKAFSYADASALAPFRYSELILSAFFGFTLFGEVPSLYTCLGALIILPSTFYVLYAETARKRKASDSAFAPEAAEEAKIS